MSNAKTSQKPVIMFPGQRDKPFVSDEEMRQRTPRPDILSVPPNKNYYDGLREAETKVPTYIILRIYFYFRHTDTENI